jgi:hypothetical protein
MPTASMRTMSAGDGAMTRRLVIFDCDGTLIDSQNSIFATMTAAYVALGLEPPSRAAVLGVVGLSLPQAFAVLAATHTPAVQSQLVMHYRSAFPHTRETMLKQDPLYPGTRETVAMLAARSDVLLGVATGKSRRGAAVRSRGMAQPFRDDPDGGRQSIQAASVHDFEGDGGDGRGARAYGDDRRHELRHGDGA